MAFSFLIFAAHCAFAWADQPQSTVRAEPIIPIAGIGSRNNVYQIEIGHKGVLKGNLADMASSSEQADDVVTLSGHPRSVHDGLQVLRIQQEQQEKQGSGCAVVGLGLILASLVGIAMKLNEAQDPYADLRGGSKPLTWVRMSVHSSMEAFDDGVPAMLMKHAQDMVACAGYMASKSLRKITAQIRRMARPNMSKFEFDDGHRGVQFTTMREESAESLLDTAPLLLPEEPKPSELAGLTMEALAQQLEGAGQDELAAQMLSSNSKSLAMGQLCSQTQDPFETEEYDL
eukprot:gnl/MRDRNA2_/MRDRNA2_91927_c0_seq1.p1 gnl/MRDRNA2_/MRDRNA2_91927_c0~~gnl/MRDRNA2_/MRDRNA2_91927_c0_seq1.p1  ORF type:complete len:287 (-),score=70.90 gnl/MRDRNA2_/MRDRNA2_91927_c0_seq1:10-870(-)